MKRDDELLRRIAAIKRIIRKLTNDVPAALCQASAQVSGNSAPDRRQRLICAEVGKWNNGNRGWIRTLFILALKGG